MYVHILISLLWSYQLTIATITTTVDTDWIILKGNSSIFHRLLSKFMEDNYHIVSLEVDQTSSTTNDDDHLAAILHRVSNRLTDVWTVTDRLSKSQLLAAIDDNEMRDLALSDVCSRLLDRRLVYTVVWRKSPNASQEIRFYNQSDAEFYADKQRFETTSEMRLQRVWGYQLPSGNVELGAVWQRVPGADDGQQQRVIFNQSIAECLIADRRYKQRGFVAAFFKLFTLRNGAINCAAIYDKRRAQLRSHLHIGAVPDAVIDSRFVRRRPPTRYIPLHISSYSMARDRKRQYAVIWATDVIDRYITDWISFSIYSYPKMESIWKSRQIPINYYRNCSQYFSHATLTYVRDKITKFMRRFNIPGAIFAIAYRERLQLAFGMGLANQKAGVPMRVDALFRVASISKPITAAAIFRLVEAGRARVDDRVFGSDSILGTRYGIAANGTYFNQMTIKHLLEHTVGAWPNGPGDPMFRYPEKSIDELAQFVLQTYPLKHAPGKKFVYSNFGYLLLGIIIETLSGESYEDYVVNEIFAAAHIAPESAFIGGNRLVDTRPGEAIYYMSNSIGDPYDLPPMERLAPFAGWVISPLNLLKLMTHLDGFPNKWDILNSTTIGQYSTATNISDETYSSGWVIGTNGWNGWWHSGILPGAASLLVRLDDGVEFVFALNKEINHQGLKAYWTSIHYLMHHIVDRLDKQWHEHDMFDE